MAGTNAALACPVTNTEDTAHHLYLRLICEMVATSLYNKPHTTITSQTFTEPEGF